MDSTGSNSSGGTDAAPAPGGLVAGLLTYQDEETAGAVAAAIHDGLACHAGGTAAIVLADAGSTDRTVARVRQALGEALLERSPTRATADLLELPYHGIPGKPRALQAVLAAARELEARACVIFDGGVRTVTPQWVELLVEPVVQHDVDFVSPVFERHAFEGALSKGIVYPVVRALYGVRLHQPAAAEFACSARLVNRFLDEDIWERAGSQAGVDLWVSTSAASGDFRLAEVALGTRTHSMRGREALDLGTTVAQVVGSLFVDLENRAGRWQRTRGSVPVPQLGARADGPPPDASSVDVDRLIEACRLGYRELRDIWTWVLPPRTIVALKRLVDRPQDEFRLDDQLWARIVYDFALGHRLRVVARDHLLRSLVPLYSGWLASYILQVRESGARSAEDRIERLADVFEAEKPYLIARWRWPERLRTG